MQKQTFERKGLPRGEGCVTARVSFLDMESGHPAHFFFAVMDYDVLLEKVETICKPVLENLGYTLAERAFVQEHGRWILRLYIDHSPRSGREGGGLSDSANSSSLLRGPAKLGLDPALPAGGATQAPKTAPVMLEDCSNASRALEGVLDVEDWIPFGYTLEVSSPGEERPLRYPADFERFAGTFVDVKSKRPLEGRHHFLGVLKGMEGQDIVIEEEGKHWHVPLAELKKAKIKRR